MNNKKRQDHLVEKMSSEYMIEGALDFSDCKDGSAVIDAACKLLVDNFDIAMNGTYIQEIIQQACFECTEREAHSRD